MKCEMCGKNESSVSALIEGVELSVCDICARHGQILKKPDLTRKAKVIKEEPEKLIVKNYAQLIKQKRESLGIKQEDFAKQLNEKLSTIQSVEAGNIMPTIQLAEKMEKKFGIKLIEFMKKSSVEIKSGDSKGFTLGDFIKK